MKTEVLVSLVSAGVALASASLSIYSQNELAQVESRLKHEIAASSLFREKQLTLYLEASEVASRIATLDDGDMRAQAIQRFNELFWGQLAVFEDHAVASAMVALRRTLEQAAPGSTALEQASLALSHACRDSLEQAWGVDLGDLGGVRDGDK